MATARVSCMATINPPTPAKAISEAVFERIDVLGVTDFTFTLTAAAKARGWDAAFGRGVLRLDHQCGRRNNPKPEPGLRRGGPEHERRSVWSGREG